MPLTRWTLRKEPYKHDPPDADNDGIVQEQTVWERPRGVRMVDRLTGLVPGEGVVGSFGNQRSQFKFQRQNPTSGVWEDIPDGSPELRPSWQGQLSIGEQRGTIGNMNNTVGGLMEPPVPPRRPYGMNVYPDDRPRVNIDASPLLDRVEREMAVFRTSSKYLDDVPADRRRFQEELRALPSFDEAAGENPGGVFAESVERLERLEDVYGEEVSALSSVFKRDDSNNSSIYESLLSISSNDSVKSYVHDSPVEDNVYFDDVIFTDADIDNLREGSKATIAAATGYVCGVPSSGVSVKADGSTVDSCTLPLRSRNKTSNGAGTVVRGSNIPAADMSHFGDSSDRRLMAGTEVTVASRSVGPDGTQIVDVVGDAPASNSVAENVPDPTATERPAGMSVKEWFIEKKSQLGGILGLSNIRPGARRDRLQRKIDREMQRRGISRDDVRYGVIFHLVDMSSRVSDEDLSKIIKDSEVYYELMKKGGEADLAKLQALKDAGEFDGDIPTIEQYMDMVAILSPANPWDDNIADARTALYTLLLDEKFSVSESAITDFKAKLYKKLFSKNENKRKQAEEQLRILAEALIKQTGDKYKLEDLLNPGEDGKYQNLFNAIASLDGVRPSDFDDDPGSLALLVLFHPEFSNILGSGQADNLAKAIRVFRDHDYVNDPDYGLNGRKAEGFSTLLSDPYYDAGVIDTWIARSLFHPRLQMVVSKKLRQIEDPEARCQLFDLIMDAHDAQMTTGQFADSLRNLQADSEILDRTGIIPLLIDEFNAVGGQVGMRPGGFQSLMWSLSRMRGRPGKDKDGNTTYVAGNKYISAAEYAAIFRMDYTELLDARRRRREHNAYMKELEKARADARAELGVDRLSTEQREAAEKPIKDKFYPDGNIPTGKQDLVDWCKDYDSYNDALDEAEKDQADIEDTKNKYIDALEAERKRLGLDSIDDLTEAQEAAVAKEYYPDSVLPDGGFKPNHRPPKYTSEQILENIKNLREVADEIDAHYEEERRLRAIEKLIESAEARFGKPLTKAQKKKIEEAYDAGHFNYAKQKSSNHIDLISEIVNGVR